MDVGDIVQLGDTTYRYIEELSEDKSKIKLKLNGDSKGLWFHRNFVVNLWKFKGSFLKAVSNE